MLTADFLNICCELCVQESKLVTQDCFDNINTIISFYTRDENSVPLNLKLRLDLVSILAKYRCEGKEVHDIITSVKTYSTKFADLYEYLNTICNKVLTEDEINKNISSVKKHKKIVSSLGNYDELRNFIYNFSEHKFDTMDQALQNLEQTVTQLYSRYSDQKRDENISNLSSLDLYSDDYTCAIDQIKLNCTGAQAVPSGYPSLDRFINKGFAPHRLYIFAGGTGDGKSSLMINMINNNLNSSAKNKEKYDIHLYVTLENLIDESFLRFYCCHTQQKMEDITNNIKIESLNMKKVLKQAQEDSKTIVIMCYYPATTISCTDILMLAEEIKIKYDGIGVLKSVWVDYLDLLKSGKSFDLYRLELGQVAVDLKVLAISLDVPVITLTQLNRSGYDKKIEMSLTQIGESIKKVEHSDFVGILRAIYKNDLSKEETDGMSDDECRLQVFIAKNRSGPKNKSISLRAEFSKSLITDLEEKIGEITIDEATALFPGSV